MRDSPGWLDGRIRRKLRYVRLRQRKRAKPIADFLQGLGVARMVSLAAEAMNLDWFREQGLITLTASPARLNQ